MKLKFYGTINDELIKSCAKGDRASQKILYDILSPKMYAVCLKYMEQHEAAEDVFQEAFVLVFKKIHQFRFEGSFEGWARRVFATKCLEQINKNKRVFHYAIDFSEFNIVPIESENPSMLDILKENDILKLIDKLSIGYQTVFKLYVIEGYSHKEIGEKLGISDGTSKSQLARARYILQGLFEKNNSIAISNNGH